MHKPRPSLPMHRAVWWSSHLKGRCLALTQSPTLAGRSPVPETGSHRAGRLTGSAVVELNCAVAVAEAEGTAAGLVLVERLDLDDFQYFHSTHADMLRRLGRTREARVGYGRALELAHREPERRLLRRRITE